MLPEAADSPAALRISKSQVMDERPRRATASSTSMRSPPCRGRLKSQETLTRGQPPRARSNTRMPRDFSNACSACSA
jgi:hypothetical protein